MALRSCDRLSIFPWGALGDLTKSPHPWQDAQALQCWGSTIVDVCQYVDKLAVPEATRIQRGGVHENISIHQLCIAQTVAGVASIIYILLLK